MFWGNSRKVSILDLMDCRVKTPANVAGEIETMSFNP